MKPMKQAKFFITTCCIFITVLLIGQDVKWYNIIDDSRYNFFEVRDAFYQEWEGKEYESGRGYKQFKRYEYLMEHRVDENGIYNPTRAQNEFLKYLKTHDINQDDRSMMNWSQIGSTSPPSTGNSAGIGRIDCITFHPTDNDTYWAGSPSGGIWKTIDNGASWQTNTDMLDGLGIADILVDASNTNIMYAATGDRDHSATSSYGVLKSTDAGATWQVSGLTSVHTIYNLLLDDSNSNNLLAGTSSGVYRSTDAGLTWANVSSIPSSNVYYIEAKPNDPSTIYASSYQTNNYQFYKSIDGGATFTVQSVPFASNSVKRASISVCPAVPDNVYLYCNGLNNAFTGIYMSTDSGISFTQITLPTAAVEFVNGDPYTLNLEELLGYQGWYDWMFQVNPLNENEMLIGAVSMARTLDGGATWQYLSTGNNDGGGIHVDFHYAQYHPNTGEAYVACDGGIWRSNGLTGIWDRLNNDLVVTQNYTLSTCLTDKEIILVGNQDNGTWVKDAGSWSFISGGDGMGCWVDPGNPNIKYTSSQNGAIYRISDAGFSVILTEEITGQVSQWVTQFDMHPEWRNKLYAIYQDVWGTDDYGDTWTKLSNFGTSTRLDILEISPSNPDVIYAGRSNSTIYRTTDAGLTWSALANSPWSVSDIAIHADNEDIIWASHYNGNVSKSIDGGQSWMDISGTLPNITASAIVYQAGSADALYLGMDKGVYYLDNTLSDWIYLGSGLPNVIVEDLEINYCEGIIRVASYGRGTWERPLYTYNSASICCPLQSPTTTPSGELVLCGVNSAVVESEVAPAGYTYQWYKDENPISGETNQTLEVTSEGHYVVKFENGTDCPSYHSDPIIVSLSNSSNCQYSACENLNLNTHNGPGNTTILEIIGPFPTSIGGAVEICVTQHGDNSFSGEVFNVFDEDNFFQARTKFGLDCDTNPLDSCFTVSASTFTNWTIDDKITLTFDPVSTAINPNLCINNSVCATIDVMIGSPNCPTTLYVPTGITSGTYAASNDVNSDGLVSSGEDVTFEAGVEIELNPNFEVPLLADFLAQIVSCVAFSANPIFAFGSNADDSMIDLSKLEVERKEEMNYKINWGKESTVTFDFLQDTEDILEVQFKDRNNTMVSIPTLKDGVYYCVIKDLIPGVYILNVKREVGDETHKIVVDDNRLSY